MNESQIMRLVRQTVREELAPILMGTVTSNSDQLRCGMKRFTFENEITGLRSILPFGVSARAPSGTDCVVQPINSDPSHLNVVGHFDQARPALQDGEAMLYDAYGHKVYLSQSKIQIGSESSQENLVLGKVFKKWAADLLKEMQRETHIGNLGYKTSPPENAAKYAALAASPIEDELILSNVAYTEK